MIYTCKKKYPAFNALQIEQMLKTSESSTMLLSSVQKDS